MIIALFKGEERICKPQRFLVDLEDEV